jgi:hypothetical protein
MPANRLAASKASYPTATTKMRKIQSTPPPRPSCLLVVIEASETLQVGPVFRASADEVSGARTPNCPSKRSPVHTPAHEITYVLCYGNCMGPEYDLGTRLTAGIRRTPRRARVTPQRRVAPALRSALPVLLNHGRAEVRLPRTIKPGRLCHSRKVVLQRLKPERSCAVCVVAEATAYKAYGVATLLPARPHSTRYKRRFFPASVFRLKHENGHF